MSVLILLLPSIFDWSSAIDLITDTTSNIFYGITDNTDGTAIFALNGFTGLNESDDLYCFVKVNQGTCDVDFFEIVWQGDR